MSNQEGLRGRLKINGKNEASNIFSGTQDNSISVRYGGKSLTLYTFNTHVVTKVSCSATHNSVEFEIKGSIIGVFEDGPLGNYYDQEYEDRTITQVNLKIDYYNDALVFRLNGLAKGYGAISRYTNKRIEDWNFETWFKIPKGDLKEFLKLQDGVFLEFEKKLLKLNPFNIEDYL